MSVRHHLGNIRRGILESLSRGEFQLPGTQPIVSFTFDDFPQSSAQVGGSILKSFGVRGTFYTAMGLMGQANALGRQFSAEDLDVLLREGHELGSHTFGHLSCRSSSLRDFEADVMRGKQAIEQITGNERPHQFSYPYGHVTLQSKRRIGSRVASCRGIVPGINESPVDLNLLRANSLYSGNFDLESVGRLLQENERRRGWLIFYTHDVAERPSQFGCTQWELTSVIGLAVKKGARILTVGQAISAGLESGMQSRPEPCVRTT